MFDIDSFYPSISEKLLLDAVNYAKNYTTVTDHQIDIIMHCRKSLLFDNDAPWVKRNNEHFDISMGSHDGAEVCELVGLFLLDDLSNKYGQNSVGLYRDDGLAVFKDLSGPDSFPVSSCWYFYCKFEEWRLEREEEVEAKGMMGRKGRREETGEDCSLQPCISVLQRCSAIFGVFSILSFRLTYWCVSYIRTGVFWLFKLLLECFWSDIFTVRFHGVAGKITGDFAGRRWSGFGLFSQRNVHWW